jgi:hypothetical protein
MRIKFVMWFTLMLAAGGAHAAASFSVQCAYSHTLPDDPIVYPGKPGEAMVHDFFGNPGSNANSTYESLAANKVTTCNASADVSSYWAPQLKRASGVIVPSYQKTYYKNDQAVVPITAPPPGLQMLAGDHMGTAPNSHVSFLCSGYGYKSTMPTTCPPSTPGGNSQLNISVRFPDCWDGHSLKPNLGTNRTERMNNLMKAANGALNVAYRNSDGTCPAAYPVKIPELQLNLAYDLGTDPDLSTAQLSLDPVFQDGQWVPQWGSMYTAHGDFFNAWHVSTMKYLVDMCMNKPETGGSCGTGIPTYYSAASADAQVDSDGTLHPVDATIVSVPGNVVLIKFPMPTNLSDYPYAKSYLQTYGGNSADSDAVMLDLYAATTTWNDGADLPAATACSTSQRIGGIYLDNVQQVRLNEISGYIASQKAAGAAQVGLCIRNNTGRTVTFSSREGTWTPGIYFK